MQALLMSLPAPTYVAMAPCHTVVLLDAIQQVSASVRRHQIAHVKGSEEKLEVSHTFNHLFKQMSARRR
jgi:hypothetical protein